MSMQAIDWRTAPADRYPWRRDDVLAYFHLPREVRERRVEERFLGAVGRAWEKNRFFAGHWRSHGLERGDVSGLADLTALPTCSVEDLRASIDREPPYGMHFDDDQTSDVDIVLSTGGTTGVPRPMLVTRANQRALGAISGRVWDWIGVRRGDTAQVLAPFSLHGASWLAQWGLQQVGARLIPSGGGATTPTVQQVELMRRFGPTALLALPNYLRIVADAASSRGVDPQELGVERILVGAEMLTPAMRLEIEQTWGARVYDVYGTVDTLVWSSIDCDANREAGGALGSHLWNDAIVAEILDERGQPCAPGEYGDLTFTSWLCSVAPRFRFRTGDRAAITTEPCPCGLDTPRMLPIQGRVDDRLRFHGVNLWPSSIDDVIHSAAPHVREYVVIAERHERRESLLVQIEGDQGDIAVPTAVVNEFKATFGIAVRAQVVGPGETASLTGQGTALKTRRVIDRREEA